MRDGWSMSTVGDLVDNLDARRVPVKKSDRRPGPYPYYGASGVVDHVDGYLFDGEFLLVAEDGENLNTRKTPIAFLASGKFWVNNHAHILRGREAVDTHFLAYYLASTDIDGYITGSAQPKLSQGNLNAIPVVLPSLEEREGIVRALRALDDKIEANRALNETLEATCQALFRSWFVDFDPVVAKAEGRRAPHLTDAVAALFPDRFEESGTWGGVIPFGWKVEPLDVIADYQNGLALQKYRPAPDEPRLPVIKIAQLRAGAPGVDEWASANIKPSCILEDGDVVFSWSGSLMVAIWCGGEAH